MRRWLRSYALLLKWSFLRMRRDLPLLLIVQTGISVGVVVGFSFFMPEVDQLSALYLATGGMTIGLITVGMVVAPQNVSMQKVDGTFDYQRSMPVPRLAILAADATIWLVMALPGLIIALVVAAFRFQLTLDVSPLVIPAVLLVAIGTVAIGYGIAYAAKPAVTGLLTQVIVVVSLMFAPISFPADRMPAWLGDVHRWLPFTYMAQAIRDTIDVPPAGISILPFGVLAAWCVIGLTITARVMTRRV